MGSIFSSQGKGSPLVAIGLKGVVLFSSSDSYPDTVFDPQEQSARIVKVRNQSRKQFKARSSAVLATLSGIRSLSSLKQIALYTINGVYKGERPSKWGFGVWG